MTLADRLVAKSQHNAFPPAIAHVAAPLESIPSKETSSSAGRFAFGEVQSLPMALRIARAAQMIRSKHRGPLRQGTDEIDHELELIGGLVRTLSRGKPIAT